jgi:hypothetical protein
MPDLRHKRATAYQVRVREIAPAMICIVTPTTHPTMIMTVQKMCGSSRKTITLTDAKAVNAAKNVPTALRNSAASTLPPEPLGSERLDAGPHMGADKQSACRSGHRKPKAFEHMGKFSYAGSHRRSPRSAKTCSLGLFSEVWKTVPTR